MLAYLHWLDWQGCEDGSLAHQSHEWHSWPPPLQVPDNISELFLQTFSHKSDSRNTNVPLSVRLSVTKTPQPLRIKPICHNAYLLAIVPIGHYIYRLSDLLSRLLSHFGLFYRGQYNNLVQAIDLEISSVAFAKNSSKTVVWIVKFQFYQ